MVVENSNALLSVTWGGYVCAYGIVDESEAFRYTVLYGQCERVYMPMVDQIVCSHAR